MAELVKIRGCDRPDRRGDVIFVHGLNGNPREYWCSPGEPDKFWPAWLGEDVSEAGVWSLGYENAALTPRRWSVARWFLQGGFAMSLVERADNVLLELVSKRVGERPLVFVTHSMGGLLVKQLIRAANDSADARQRAIVEQTRGVCFIATPHIGADPAKWASYFGKLLGTTVAMAELKSHAPHLLNLNQWYRNFVSREHCSIKTLTFYEKKPLPVIGLIVAEGDADPGVADAGIFPLDEDHISICKPGSKNPQIHQAVRDFIRRDCLRLDGGQSAPGPLPSPVKPAIPKDEDSSAPEPTVNNAPNETKQTTKRKKKPQKVPPADRLSGEAASSESDPQTGEDSYGESKPFHGEAQSRWEEYRIGTREHLDGLLGKLSQAEGQGGRILGRVAKALEIADVPDDVMQLRKRIADYLVDAQDEYAIPRIIGLHGELCGEGLDRPADQLAACVDRILPLYFSREAVSKAWHQLQVQKVVLIERTVATVTGAEIVMSYLDKKMPSFLPHELLIPQGKTFVPLELPAIGNPSSEAEVLAILEDLARGAGVVPIDRARRESHPREVAARTKQLSQDLCGWLKGVKPLTGRTPYCALAMPEKPADEHLKRSLREVQKLIPHLVFIELYAESRTREQEVFFIRCLTTRLKSERKRKSR
jgi:pimeloyl-ACP methyl ester carboxylesterase